MTRREPPGLFSLFRFALPLATLASLFAAAPAWGGHPSTSEAPREHLAAGARTAAAARPALGPFRIAGADSMSWLSFSFAAQIRMDYVSEDRDPGRVKYGPLVMKARRIRPTIGLNLPEQRLSFRLHLSTAPGSIELMDFYFNYDPPGKPQVRLGQFKVPLTRYRMQSFQRLTFVDWAIVSPAFGAERQIGVALHNGYEKPTRYAYAFGVFSGQNARAAHAVTLPRLYGIKPENPSDLAHPASAEDFHPELVLHLAYNARGISVQSDTDAEGGGLRYSLMLSAAWDADSGFHRDFVFRLSPELLAKFRGLSVSAIGYGGWAEAGESRVTKLAMVGGLLQCAYRFAQRYEVSARYAMVDADDVSFREEEARVGFNLYIIDHLLKWQSDLGRLTSTRPDESAVAYDVRSQLQLTF